MIELDGLRYPATPAGVVIAPFERSHLPDAVALAAAGIGRLRAAVPSVPEEAAHPGRLGALLTGFAGDDPAGGSGGLVAVRHGRLAGYLGWFLVDDFRGTGRRAALCPAWGYAAPEAEHAALLPALYREATHRWAAAGCGGHAIALPACEAGTIRAAGYLGFGVAVIDAIRPVGDHRAAAPAGVAIRKAVPADLDGVAALEVEHRRYHTRPPVLVHAEPPDRDEIRAALAGPVGGSWLALADGAPVGFLRMAQACAGATELVRSRGTVAVTAAFVLPEWRGRGVGSALLETALGDCAGRGYDRCSVDFESFNPEARAFWLRSFTPVCVSLIRYPERAPTP